MLNPKVTRAICLSLGVFVLALGCILIPVFNHVIHQTIVNELPLKENSMTYDYWVVPPVPIYFALWVFDLKNPMEVVQRGARPVVFQKGPYTYREYRQKMNITFEANNTVTYREKKWYKFDRSKSCGPETDQFTTVNIAMVTMANLIRFEYSWITELVELVLDASHDNTLFSRYRVKDVAWGYDDPLLRTVNDILQKYNKTVDDKIGIFYGQNNTDDGQYNIYTGSGDVSKLAIINTWEGMKNLPYWTSDTCRMINGTDGTFFPPFVEKSETLYVFSTDVCRSLYLYYKERKTLRGVDLYSFVVPDRLFANISENEGFCTPSDNCLPSGLLNVSRCKQESAPIVLSQPHFYGADPSVQQAVLGLTPTPSVHQTNIDIEPNTGIAMNVDKRLQINIYIQNISNIRSTQHINNLVYPVLWLNESAALDRKQASTFKSDVSTPIKITQAVQYGLIILGALIALCTLTFMIKACTDKDG